MVLFGPSGSGKTTVLRCLAGLDRPGEGWIRFRETPWLEAPGTWVPPQARPVGFVAQEGLLFPHMTVADNIAYGLRALPARERMGRVGDMVERTGLRGLEARLPGQLSGGQRRRVALARALARRPALLLLDEPFSGLDEPGLAQLRPVLRGLLKEMSLPVILVTHDRVDAIRLGDRILVMDQGFPLQEGPLAEVCSRPALPAVARILGVETVLPGRVLEVRDGLALLEVGRATLLAPDPGGLGGGAFVCIRGEDVLLEVGQTPSTARNRLPGRIRSVHMEGPLCRVEVDCGLPLTALVTRRAWEELSLAEGTAVTALVKATAIHLIPHD